MNAILELRLYQLTGLERDKVKAEYDAVLVDIKDLLDILAREQRVLVIIKDELRLIKDKFATPRRCNIVAEVGEVAMEDLIANDAMIVTLSHRGYIKAHALQRIPACRVAAGKASKAWRSGRRKGRSRGFHRTSLQRPGARLPAVLHEHRPDVCRARLRTPGRFAHVDGPQHSEYLNLKPDEKSPRCSGWSATVDENGNDITFREEAGFIFFATRSGKVKKTAVNEFRNYRKGRYHRDQS